VEVGGGVTLTTGALALSAQAFKNIIFIFKKTNKIFFILISSFITSLLHFFKDKKDKI
jgi:hypothetical protein